MDEHLAASAAHTALLVIDLQRQFTEPGAPFEVVDADGLLERTNRAVRIARNAGDTVIWVSHEARPQVGPGRTSRRYGVKSIHQGDGAKLDPRLDRLPDEILVIKPRQSAFFGTDLDVVLRSLNVARVVIAGVTTNVCCLATAKDAAERDYEVVVLEDCTASLPVKKDGVLVLSADDVQKAALAFVTHALGEVMTADSWYGTEHSGEPDELSQ